MQKQGGEQLTLLMYAGYFECLGFERFTSKSQLSMAFAGRLRAFIIMFPFSPKTNFNLSLILLFLLQML